MNQSLGVKTRREISGQERYPIPHGKHRRPKELLFVKREISSVATPHFLDAGHWPFETHFREIADSTVSFPARTV
jgi:hypothetical protein